MAIGTDPIAPPFLMARLIADGPGYQFSRRIARQNSMLFAVMLTVFLLPRQLSYGQMIQQRACSVWRIQTHGVPCRSEQVPFALDVIRSDPIGVLFNAGNNFIREFMSIGIDQFFLDQQHLQWAKEKLPADIF